MKPVYHNVIQNSDEWFNLRLGKFTSSSFKDLFMSKTTKGYEKAIYKVVYENLTKEAPENFTSEYMQRGHEIEPLAKDCYEIETFNEVQEGGFFQLGKWIGASPDGLIDDDGILEIKSPAFNTMINYLLKKELPSLYKWQVQGQLYVTGRKWCDFMAYHPKLEPLIIRVERDEHLIVDLQNKLNESIEEVKRIINKLS